MKWKALIDGLCFKWLSKFSFFPFQGLSSEVLFSIYLPVVFKDQGL